MITTNTRTVYHNIPPLNMTGVILAMKAGKREVGIRMLKLAPDEFPFVFRLRQVDQDCYDCMSTARGYHTTVGSYHRSI